MGEAVKIIDVDDSGESFVLLEDALRKVFEKVPDELPVGIISVVGAFRTGKSFLLDFFLRYLKNTDGKVLDTDLDVEDEKLEWVEQGGRLEGADISGSKGFRWSSDEEPCTKGIWMWSEYFTRPDPMSGAPMAILLMDTQGMYGPVAGEHLNATIFSLGSLLSSYTIFNLSKQLQENHIQELALLSEYGRVANQETRVDATASDDHSFQTLEFLVRDFGHFQKGSKKKDLETLQADMNSYLEDFMTEGALEDLNEARQRIMLCYQKLRCYCLPYPGAAVAGISSDFDGDVSKLRSRFRRFLGDYTRRAFNDRITSKKIHGETVTASKLVEFFKAYCKVFKESKVFPNAQTLFRASVSANNNYAVSKGSESYKEAMKMFGLGTKYLKESVLKQANEKSIAAALESFQKNVQFGNEAVQNEAKQTMLELLRTKFEEYGKLNKWKGIEEAQNRDMDSASSIEIKYLRPKPPSKLSDIGSPIVKLQMLIGHGEFSEIYKGSTTSRTLAVKRIRYKALNPVWLSIQQQWTNGIDSTGIFSDERNRRSYIPTKTKVSKVKEISKEIYSWHECHHEYTLRMHDVFLQNSSYWIVSEYYIGNISLLISPDKATKLPSTPLNLIYHVIAPIIKAVKYSHSKGLVHRGISLQNIVISEFGIPKLSDFRRAIDYDGKMMDYDDDVGTPYFVPPELCRKEKYDQTFDTWSLGMVMLSLFQFHNKSRLYTWKSLESSFQQLTNDENSNKAIQMWFRIAPSNIPNCDEDIVIFRGVMRQILVFNPAERPMVSDLLQIPIIETHCEAWRLKRKSKHFRQCQRLLKKRLNESGVEVRHWKDNKDKLKTSGDRRDDFRSKLFRFLNYPLDI